MPSLVKPVRREIQIPSASRRALVRAATFDKARRTFEIVWGAGAVVRRYDWWNDREFEEELLMTPEACDLSRLKARAPFLLDHNAWSVRNNVAGAFEDAWLENGQGIGRIQASGREEFRGIFEDVAAGILCHTSVGYQVFEFQDVTAPDAKIRRFRAVNWQPFEASLVCVAADDASIVRAAPATNHTCTVSFFQRNTAMDPELDSNGNPVPARSADPAATTGTLFPAAPAATRAAAPSPAPAPAAAPAPAPAAAPARDAGALERERILGIQDAGRRLRATPEAVRGFIDQGLSLDRARALMVDGLADVDDQSATRASAQVGADPREGMRGAMEDYLLHRVNPAAFPMTNARAREYVGFTLVELGRACLAAKSEKVSGLSRFQIVTRALITTSDFPLLLANIGTKTLRKGYESYPSNWRSWTRVVNAMDFKPISALSLADSPKLLKVEEAGEFKRGKLFEAGETYKVETYGRVIGLTRQAIVNDDLDAFSRIPAMFGSSAAALVADLVFAVLTANPLMADGVPLFHATHANLGDKVFGLQGLNQLRALMRLQVGPNGQLLNVGPATVIVPTALETQARQILFGEISPATVGNVNTFKGTLNLVVDPRLDADSAIEWYVAADPAMMDTIQVSFLEGEGEGPMIESRVGFDVDGVEIKARLDVGVAPVETRGLAKSSGTVADS